MDTQIIILGAGHGKRMQSELPKALTPLRGKPFIVHLLETIQQTGIDNNPIIVVGQKREQIMDALGPSYRYAIQDEQLGTGHAVLMTEKFKGDSKQTLILYADHPLVSVKTIQGLIEAHKNEGAVLTMATARIPDFEEWRSTFLSFGRFVRDEKGIITRIVEAKDATDEEKLITEVNPAYMCFDTEWLWKHLSLLKNNNNQKEYYLTDLVSMAFAEKQKIASVAIDPREALGVNTKEQLELIESL